MMGATVSELRKLTTTRTTWVVTAIGLVLVAMSVGFFVLEQEMTGPFLGSDAEVAATIDQIGSMGVIVLVIGLLSVTTEFRHGTIGRTLQLTPSRTSVLFAKGLVAIGFGVAFFLLGIGIVAAFLAVVGSREGVDVVVASEAREALWQGPVGLALTAVFGVALGALIRSQVVAITITLLWVFIGEQVFVQFLPSVGRWLPFQALQSVFLSDEVTANVPEGMVLPLDPMVGLGVFLAYVVVFATAAIVLLRYRDV